jgi:hypothetical protein
MEAGSLEDAYKHWLCRGCNGPTPIARSIDVCLETPATLEKPMTGLSGGFPGIALKELISQISPEAVERDLFLGQVFLSDGTLLSDWVTYHGRHRLIIRGTKHISQRVCPDCGRLVYFAMGKRHLFPDPPLDATLYESDLSGIILNEVDFNALDLSKWRRGFYVDRLPVAEWPPQTN